MANTINWGKIYCSSWWGDEDNKLSVPEFPADCQLYQGVCGTEYSYAGGQDFPTRYQINISENGVVDFDWTTGNIPDKFIIVQDDVVLLDTGYRGDTSYQSDLDTELASRGLPSETIISGTSGTETFTITSDEPLLVYVYAPLTGTGWYFTTNCPLNSIIADYRTRVLADGGTFVYSDCLNVF